MAFKGLRVFISRKDFPPQFIDSAQDMLRANGAEICICSNISCNASTDFHVFPSSQHEKVAEYLNNGCNVIGPDCLVGCAKEHRSFPRQGYRCCLAMEGVKVLATGFDKAEKVEIEKIVKSMCGEIETKVLTNVSFVIAKDVLAAKYKFAVNSLRKPIVKLDWLFQCWREHRLVPHEQFRLPPFVGLTICATNIPLDERKRIEDACIENGDKFRVARRWGTVRIVNRQWFEQCLAAKACLDEDLFPVNAGKEKAVTLSQVSKLPPYISPVENMRAETVTSSAISVVSITIPCDQALHSNSGIARPGSSLQEDEQSIANRNENSRCDDDDNMYLSNCRIYFSGFSAVGLRKYANMVRDGGGTRFMEFNDRVTHVVVGDLLESSEKDVRQSSCMSSIHCVRPLWLEDCHRQRKEAFITQSHLLSDGLFEKKVESGSQDRSGIEGMHTRLSGKQQLILPQSLDFEVDRSASYQEGHSCESKSLFGSKGQLEVVNSMSVKERSGPSAIFSSSCIFEGYTFAICDSFPVDRRAEIVQWVVEGGGMMETQNPLQRDATRKTDFLVVTHGFKLASAAVAINGKPVSSHWIRFCLEEKRLLDLDSHVLYRPLQCQVPFPGFQALRLCVSQYEEKDRLLLRNLCFVLGVKFTEKLNKKVTHLLCKVKDGQKFHAACNWGIAITTADWLFACVSKDKSLPLTDFQPREISAAEKDVGLGMTQGYGQGGCPASKETYSEFSAMIKAKKSAKQSAKTSGVLVDASVAHLSERNSYFLSMQTMQSQEQVPFLDPWDEQTVQWPGGDDGKHNISDPAKTIHSSFDEGDSSYVKPSQTFCGQFEKKVVSSNHSGDPPGIQQSIVTENEMETHRSSDVAAAIEGLLAQTSNLKANNRLDSFSIDQQISPEHTTLKRSREDSCYKGPNCQEIFNERRVASTAPQLPSTDLPAFDESQMESQMIGYDEDHVGKQLIIERVRTRSTSTIHPGRPAGKEASAWRNDGLGRLFKVAEANK